MEPAGPKWPQTDQIMVQDRQKLCPQRFIDSVVKPMENEEFSSKRYSIVSLKIPKWVQKPYKTNGKRAFDQKRTCNCADSLVKPMENEEILLNGMKIDAKSIKFPCKTNEILTFRVQKRYQNHSKPCKTNGKQANGLAAGRRGHFFAQTISFCARKKKCLISSCPGTVTCVQICFDRST